MLTTEEEEVTKDELPWYEMRLGRKKLYGIPKAGDPGIYVIKCDCDVAGDAHVSFEVPAESAGIYFTTPRAERGATHKLFPDLTPELREILITGDTPAEYDYNQGKLSKKDTSYEQFKERYRPRGYVFDDDDKQTGEDGE